MESEMATVLREGAQAFFPFQLLNSYFEIRSNPEKSAVNPEAAGPGTSQEPFSQRGWVGAGWGRRQ